MLSTASLIPEDSIDLRERDLRGVDLSNHDLRGRDFRGALLIGANLAGAELSGADLSGADLSDVNAVGAGFGTCKMEATLLNGASLSKASFTDANLKGASFQSADLTEARLMGANLEQADLACANLTSACLQRATLDYAVFRDANLTRTRFVGARGYTTVHWIGVNILDADLNGANLFRRHVMDTLYLDEFKNQSKSNRVIYALWSITSDCGRSLGRWSAFTALLAFTFMFVFEELPIDFGPNETWLSPLYFSIVTLTTLGFGDVLPTSIAGQVAVILEVSIGYVMLGGLISILSNKMARRA